MERRSRTLTPADRGIYFPEHGERNEPVRALAQHLIDRGWLTAERVRRALEAQAVAGGLFGTCLLELGYLTEERLLEALSHVFATPAALADDLRRIKQSHLQALPREFVLRDRLLPFRAVGGEVWVACENPLDADALSRASAACGKRLRPHVTTEPRLVEALARDFGAACPQRFELLIARLNRPASPWTEQAHDLPRIIELTAEERELLEATRSGRRPPRAPEAPAAPSTQPINPLVADPRPAPRLEERLRQADSLAAIGEAVLEHLAPHCQRTLLFKVQDEGIRGWLGRGAGVVESRLRRFTAPFDRPSVFLNLREGAGLHLGPLPEMPVHLELAKVWGGGLPPAVIVLPVRVRDRLVAAIYCDQAASDALGFDLAQVQSVGANAALAFEQHLVRKKSDRSARS